MSDVRVSFPKPCSERWEAMRPEGCNRFCERCEKLIHDLSQLTLQEAEHLVRSGTDICVRAEVGVGGVIKLKGSDGRKARRMVAAIGASVGILAASGQAAAAEGAKLGAIKGEVVGACGGSVSATAADGRVYHAKIGLNGRYKVKRLPAGSYEVKLDDAGPATSPEVASGNPVMVESGRTSVLNIKDANTCIIVGMLEIEDRNG